MSLFSVKKVAYFDLLCHRKVNFYLFLLIILETRFSFFLLSFSMNMNDFKYSDIKLGTCVYKSIQNFDFSTMLCLFHRLLCWVAVGNGSNLSCENLRMLASLIHSLVFSD